MSNMPSPDAPRIEPRIDARPQMVADDRSIWAEAERQRDDMAEAMQTSLDALNLEALVYRSPPGEYPVYVVLEAWELQDEDGGVERMTREHLRITIDALPYHARPFRYTVELRNSRRRVRREFRDPTRLDVDELVDFALSRGRFPRGLRFSFDEFGVNLAERIWPRLLVVEEARGALVTWPKALVIVALVLALLPLAPLSQLLAVVAIVAAIVIAVRRPHLYGAIRRPPTSPRSLTQVDFWHVNLPDVADEAASIRSRIETALDKLDKIERRWEAHQVRIPYGYEEHQWLVLTKGQAIVYVVIYKMGSDLLVGWEGYLNWACWAEASPTITCVQRGERVEFRSLTLATYVPGWTDLSDLTALMQGVHLRISEVVRVFAEERDIKSDIDFSIIRSDRATLLAGDTSRRSTGELQKTRGSGSWRKYVKRG